MMVSNVQDSTPVLQPLSYADRVKKSQRKDAATASIPQRQQPRSMPSPLTSATLSAPKVAKPPALEPSVQQREVPAPADRPTQSFPDVTAHPPKAKLVNGETSSSSADPMAGLSSVPVKKIAPQPAVNVWSLRKEQMARAHTQSIPRSSDLSSQATTSSASVPDSTPVPSSSSGQESASATVEVKDAEVVGDAPIPDPAGPGSTAPGEEDEYTWVVRPHLAPAAVPLPPLDATSWPEVGKASLEHPLSSSQAENSGGSEREDKTKKEAQGSGQRRVGEKPKWVPIPPEELRAAADAQRSTRTSSASHSRSQSQQRIHNRAQSSSSGSAGRSNHASQERSKAQSSVSRDRPSAAHSEVHSRSGSIQSSPKHSSMRHRRLPDEAVGSSSRKSSRTNSPRPYPPAGTLVSAAVAEIPYGPISQPDMVNGTSYYPVVSQPHAPSPYSITPPYPPPPGAIPLAYNPTYPYIPYAYGPVPGQPYPMYWPAMHQDSQQPYSMSSQSQSPATHPSSLARSDVASPPTSVGPSSTEENSESTTTLASAGAKDVSDESQKPLANRKSSRGRQRLLSFGSIRADGEIIDGNEDAGVTEAAEASAEKTSSLGLDVGSIKISDNVDVTPRNAERSTSKLNPEVPAFSIRLTSRDPGSSKQKTQDATPTSNGALTHGDTSANEKTLGTSTWEFGTTRRDTERQNVTPMDGAAQQSEPETSEGLTNPSELAAPEGIPLRVRLSPLSSVVNAEGLPPTPIPPSAGPALYASNNPLPFENSAREDEWRVRDFGYGFGRRPDGTYATREDRPFAKDKPYYGGRSAPRSYESEGFRRGFGGRRGRGSSRGFGRGGRRGDYRGSFSRYAPPDMEFQADEGQGVVYGVPLVDPGVYYGAPLMPPANYMPPAYGGYGYAFGYPIHPVPVIAQPSAPLSAPSSSSLDPRSSYLLGQLEYYLSEDNLAQDLYLRKQMDSHGWISHRLLASFRRVKAITDDPQLVKDVLASSSLVEVKGDFVRPYKWSHFVLPNAKTSVVDGSGILPVEPASSAQVDVEQLLLQHPPPKTDAADSRGTLSQAGLADSHVPAEVNHALEHTPEDRQEYEDEEEVVEEEEEDEDEDEDDVEFVLG